MQSIYSLIREAESKARAFERSGIIEKRLAFFISHVDYKKILDTYDGYEFSEYVVNRWGDVNTYRVYGDTEDTMEIFER